MSPPGVWTICEYRLSTPVSATTRRTEYHTWHRRRSLARAAPAPPIGQRCASPRVDRPAPWRLVSPALLSHEQQSVPAGLSLTPSSPWDELGNYIEVEPRFCSSPLRKSRSATPSSTGHRARMCAICTFGWRPDLTRDRPPSGRKRGVSRRPRQGRCQGCPHSSAPEATIGPNPLSPFLMEQQRER